MSALPDFREIKTRQQAVWGSGDYSVIGTTLQIVGESLAEACDIKWDEEVLDVAAGNGNVTLAAARRGAKVTSTDFVATLLNRADERLRAERLSAKLEFADAEALPYIDGSFDVVVSTFGAMFAPNQPKVADELARVCRSGGRIGMANWTPDGFIGQIFKTLGRHIPPTAGLQSPAAWGVEKNLHAFFERTASNISIEPKVFNFRYRSAAHFVEVFRAWYGPMQRAFVSLDEAKAEALQEDLIALANQMNRAGPHSLVIPSTYLEMVVARR